MIRFKYGLGKNVQMLIMSLSTTTAEKPVSIENYKLLDLKGMHFKLT